MPEVHKSCCDVDTPGNAICMKQMKYTHLKYRKRLGFWQVLFLPQTSVFSHFSHHNKILQERQRWEPSPQGTSVRQWMAIYLRVQ